MSDIEFLCGMAGIVGFVAIFVYIVLLVDQ